MLISAGEALLLSNAPLHSLRVSSESNPQAIRHRIPARIFGSRIAYEAFHP